MRQLDTRPYIVLGRKHFQNQSLQKLRGTHNLFLARLIPLFLLEKTNRDNEDGESKRLELVHHLSGAIKLLPLLVLLGFPITDPLNNAR